MASRLPNGSILIDTIGDPDTVPGSKPGEYVTTGGTQDDLDFAHQQMLEAYDHAYCAYEAMLERGIVREVARAPLGVGIYSSMYATCNLRSLMAFLSLRTHEPEAHFPSTPQFEIEQCARMLEKAFAEHFPVVYEAFNRHGRVCP